MPVITLFTMKNIRYLKITKHHISKLLILFIATMLLSSCTVKLIYNQLDWLVPIYVRTYIKLNDEQKDYLSDAIDKHWDWHRKTQLPAYVDYLATIGNRLEQGFTQEQLVAQNAQLEQFGKTFVLRVAPDVNELLITSSDKQLQKLFKKLNKDYQTAKKSFEKNDDEAIKKKHLKEMRSYLIKWIGKLNNQQSELLQAWYEQYIPIEKEVLQHQLDWQNEFKNILTQPSDKSDKERRLTELYLNPEQFIYDEYEKKLDHNTKITEELIVAVSHSLTAKQIKKAQHRLTEFAEDLQDLHRK